MNVGLVVLGQQRGVNFVSPTSHEPTKHPINLLKVSKYYVKTYVSFKSKDCKCLILKVFLAGLKKWYKDIYGARIRTSLDPL